MHPWSGGQAPAKSVSGWSTGPAIRRASPSIPPQVGAVKGRVITRATHHRKTAEWLAVRKLPPTGMEDLKLEREEMIRILEEIARDPDTNPTA